MPLVATAAAMHLRPEGLSTVADATEAVEWVAHDAEVTQPQVRSEDPSYPLLTGCSVVGFGKR